MSVVKKYGVDYHHEYKKSGNYALTLNSDEVTDIKFEPDRADTNTCFTKTHKSGWTISAFLHQDWYVWVNEFVAIHRRLGTVSGDYESEIVASSNASFDDFYKNHTPNSWDYYDI